MPCIVGPINTVAVSFEKLTDNKGVFIHEVIFWDFEVEGSRAFTDTPRCVVVRTVAGAVVTTEVSHVSNGYTTQMCAHSKQNEPLVLLHTHIIVLWVTEGLDVDRLFSLDLLSVTMSDKQRLVSPLEDGTLAFWDVSKFHLDFGERKYISRSAHC